MRTYSEKKENRNSARYQETKSTGGQSMAPPAFQLKNDPIQMDNGGEPVGPGYYAAGKTSRELGFALRHPIAAMAIGVFSSGSLNISTKAIRFSTNDLGLGTHPSREGSEVNAFRHALWQAEITEEYGSQIATEAGNAHEINPFAINGKNGDTTTFKNRADADESCDLRNNVIGRSIGTANDEAEMNKLALKVLEHFHTHGLWVVEELEDGTFKAVQHPIPDDQYEEARKRLLQLNKYGFDNDQWSERTKKAHEWAKGQRARMFHGGKI